MTQFQMLSLGVFVGIASVAYRKELYALVKALLNRGGISTPTVNKSIAVTIVDDLVSVTELRDKLAAEDCPQGVEACTSLLRVIVEHIPPAKTA
jgi:hypothetical protein